MSSCAHVVLTTAKQVISRRRKNEIVCGMSKNEKCTCKAWKSIVFHCQICKFVTFLSPLSSWLRKLPTDEREERRRNTKENPQLRRKFNYYAKHHRAGSPVDDHYRTPAYSITHTAQAILRSHMRKSVIRPVQQGLTLLKSYEQVVLCITLQKMWAGDTDGSGFAKHILRGSPSIRWKPCPTTLHCLEKTQNGIFLGQAIQKCHALRSLPTVMSPNNDNHSFTNFSEGFLIPFQNALCPVHWCIENCQCSCDW